MPISFASLYLNTQEKRNSTNELELLSVVWSVDRFKHYLLGREFTIETDHKALTSALSENRANKTYQSRLTRCVDRSLTYQSEIVHIPGKDMDIVDYLSGSLMPIHGQCLNLMKSSWLHRLKLFMKPSTVGTVG